MRILLRNGRVPHLPDLAGDPDLPVLRRLPAGGRTIHDRETA